MKFSDILKLIITLNYRVILPLILTLITTLKWSRHDIQLDRTMFSCSLLLFLRIENILAVYRLYLQKTAYEYEATIVLMLVKIINSLENESI